MSITRLQQARQMYAMGQRVAKTLDGSRPGYAGWNPGVGSTTQGRELGAMANQAQSTPDTTAGPPQERHNPHEDDGLSPVSTPDITTPTTTTPNFSIHEGPDTVPAYDDFPTAPSTNYSVGLVPGVDYRYVQDPNSQFAKNTYLTNNFPEYSFNSNIPSLNFLGNTLGKFTYNTSTNFFKKNNIGGKINPKTGEPFGYGIDGYKDYMEQRTLGTVGAYGNENMGQNAINARSGGDDGIMDVYNTPNYTDDGDADGDGDVDQDDFIFRYFDKTGETLQAGAGGVEDLMTQIRKRISNIFS